MSLAPADRFGVTSERGEVARTISRGRIWGLVVLVLLLHVGLANRANWDKGSMFDESAQKPVPVKEGIQAVMFAHGCLELTLECDQIVRRRS